MAPSAYNADVTPSICAGARKPAKHPIMRPRKEKRDAHSGAIADDRVAIPVKYLIPSLTTSLLPTMLEKILIMPYTAMNDENSFMPTPHSDLTRIWNVSCMWLGSDCIMMRTASIRTSFEWRKRMLVQDDRGDWSNCFLIRGLFSCNGIRFDGCKDSCIPKKTSAAVSADTNVDAP